jgi:truncated hemoglobin YjbI
LAASDLFQAIGGTVGCRKLAEAFYAKVQQDRVLRPFFPGKSMRCAIEQFSGFLVQFLGGPDEETQKRWWLSLRESHLRFRIGAKEQDAWLKLMAQAIGESSIEEPARRALLGFFAESSAYLVNQGNGVVSPPAAGQVEIERHWQTQQEVDRAVDAVQRGDAAGAIVLAKGCGRARFTGLLVLMIGRGEVSCAEEQVRADPTLITARYGGRTLLHAAAAAGALSTVNLLLELGTDPNVLDAGGHAPLYSAGNECAQGGGDVVRSLVSAGAVVHACGGVQRCTALHMAARRGNVEIAAALLDCGANIDARDKQGATPLRRAVNCRKPEVAALLRARGARAS